MNAENIYTRSYRGLDKGVWVLVLATMVLSLGLLSFFVIKRNNCIPFSISVASGSDSVYYTGKTINFNTTISAKEMIWDFDDSTARETGIYVKHAFSKPGKYSVRAWTQAACEETFIITVKQDPNDIRGSEIFGDEVVKQNKDVEYFCTKYASKSHWAVVGHSNVPITMNGIKARFRFPSPGTYTIQVTLEGERLVTYSKDIVVLGENAPPQKDKPFIVKPLVNDPPTPEPKPQVIEAPVSIIQIPESAFKGYLKAIMNDESGRKSLADFDQFLYLKGETKVRLSTGENFSFAAFYSKLPSFQDKMTIDKVEFVKSAPEKIQLIRVYITKL